MNFLQLFEKNRFGDYFLSRKWSEMKGGKFKNLPPTHKGTKRCKDKRLEGTWKGVERRKKERERGRGRGKASTRPSCHVQLSRLGGFKGSVREPSRV